MLITWLLTLLIFKSLKAEVCAQQALNKCSLTELLINQSANQEENKVVGLKPGFFSNSPHNQKFVYVFTDNNGEV